MIYHEIDWQARFPSIAPADIDLLKVRRDRTDFDLDAVRAAAEQAQGDIDLSPVAGPVVAHIRRHRHGFVEDNRKPALARTLNSLPDFLLALSMRWRIFGEPMALWIRKRLSGLQYLARMESLARGAIVIVMDGNVACGLFACIPVTEDALGGLLCGRLGSFDLLTADLVAKPGKAKSVLITNFLNLHEGRFDAGSGLHKGVRAIRSLQVVALLVAGRFLDLDSDPRILATADHAQGTRVANAFAMKNMNKKTRLTESLWELELTESVLSAMRLQRQLEWEARR